MATAGTRPDPEVGLRAVAALRGLLEVLEALQVDNARASGWSWQQIASRLGATKQAVHQSTAPAAAPAREVATMHPIEPIPRAVDIAKPAGLACTKGRWEASRLHHAYVGPEHLLLGLLSQGDNPAARILAAHGLDLETVRAEVDRLIAQNVLPSPHLGDAASLATLGIDLEAVAGRVEESFGREAYWQATERVRNRPIQAATHRPMGVPPPFVCTRVFAVAAHEAIARDQPVGPKHLLLGLLRDAEDPVETEPYPQERRLRGPTRNRPRPDDHPTFMMTHRGTLLRPSGPVGALGCPAEGADLGNSRNGPG